MKEKPKLKGKAKVTVYKVEESVSELDDVI